MPIDQMIHEDRGRLLWCSAWFDPISALGSDIDQRSRRSAESVGKEIKTRGESAKFLVNVVDLAASYIRPQGSIDATFDSIQGARLLLGRLEHPRPAFAELTSFR
jgi:hypothetical protein